MDDADTTSRENDRAKARLALTLAARALDPGDAPDLQLAATLLARAGSLAIGVLGHAAKPDVAQSVAELDDATLIEIAGGRVRAMELAEAIDHAARGEPARASELLDAELFVTRLVERASGKKRRRWPARGAWIAAAVAVVGVLAVRAADAPYPGRFRASSAWGAPYEVQGELGAAPLYTNFFHTREENEPWVEIDLGRDRKVSEIKVLNRYDCCTDRAIPLEIAIRADAGEYHVVANRQRDFSIWKATFQPEVARFVKLTVRKTSSFHLRGVEVR